MAESTKIVVRYHGPEVDDGTMAISLVADVLDGFAAAYRKTAAYIGSPDRIPELRISTPEKGSFTLLVVAGILLLEQAPGTLLAIEYALDFAKHVGRVLAGVIDLKKMLKGETNYKVEVRGNNNLVLVGNNIEAPPTREIFEVFEAKLLDRDLQKIVRPLEPKRIDTAELAVAEEMPMLIKSDERKYFNPEPTETATRGEELTGTLVSTNKEYKRGTFRMQNGRTVPYHFVGESDDQFLRDFSYKGEVRVLGDVTTDENGRPMHLAIHSVERLQPNIPFAPPRKK